jgi:hypothetical protein
MVSGDRIKVLRNLQKLYDRQARPGEPSVGNPAARTRFVWAQHRVINENSPTRPTAKATEHGWEEVRIDGTVGVHSSTYDPSG